MSIETEKEATIADLKQIADNIATGVVRNTMQNPDVQFFNVSMTKIQEARQAFKKVENAVKGLNKIMHKFYIAENKKAKEIVFHELAFWYGEYLRSSASYVDKYKHFEIAYVSQLREEKGETENGNSSNSETNEPA